MPAARPVDGGAKRDDCARPVVKRARAWLEAHVGSRVLRLDALAGGMGARRYWRVGFADGTSAVLMHALPEDPAILPPALRTPGDEIPFVAMTGYLAARGLPVPRLLAVEPDERWVLLEDLGDTHLCDLEPARRSPRLREAVELIAALHAGEIGPALPYRREFDVEWIRFELRTFAEHGRLSVGQRLNDALERLAQAIARLPRVLCLRDFQSQNLLIDPQGRLRVIDYQDALLAPAELDLAALLYDSYIEIDPRERAALRRHYASARAVELDPGAFALLVVQRKCKDFGRYRFMVERKGDARYAPYLGRARDAVLELLPELPADLSGLAPPLRDALQGAAAR